MPLLYGGLSLWRAKYEWEKAFGVRKCIMCSKRVVAGKQTAVPKSVPPALQVWRSRRVAGRSKKRIHETRTRICTHLRETKSRYFRPVAVSIGFTISVSGTT